MSKRVSKRKRQELDSIDYQYASTKGHKSNKRNPSSVQFTSPSMIGGEAHCRSSGDMAGRTTYEILHAMIAQAQAQQDSCAPQGHNGQSVMLSAAQDLRAPPGARTSWTNVRLCHLWKKTLHFHSNAGRLQDPR